MKSLSAIAVTQINDSYPNVKYKLGLLSSLDEFNYSENIFDIKNNKSFHDISSSFNYFSKIIIICKILYGHLLVLFRHLKQQPEVIYIAYPGIALAFIISIISPKRNTEIYLDAFISIYDTVVNDRKTFPPSHWLSRLLFIIEKRAFSASKAVIVDTEENVKFYSTLFGLPKNKFIPIPLCIPPLPEKPLNIDKTKFTCVFFGTFVPLQGTQTIIDAALSLSGNKGIQFILIGDGQDAQNFEDRLRETAAQNIIWHRGHFPTKFIIEQLSKADVCFGVFGKNDKTQRILPYKLYYSLAMGIPILTSRTEIILRLCKDMPPPAFITCEPGDAGDLGHKIVELAHSKDQLIGYRKASRQFYKDHLSNRIILSKLRKLFSE